MPVPSQYTITFNEFNGGWRVGYGNGRSGLLSAAIDPYLKALWNVLRPYNRFVAQTPADIDALVAAAAAVVDEEAAAGAAETVSHGDFATSADALAAQAADPNLKGYTLSRDPQTGRWTLLAPTTHPLGPADSRIKSFQGYDWAYNDATGQWDTFVGRTADPLQGGQTYATFEEAQANTPTGFRPTQLNNGMWGFERVPEKPTRDYWQQIEDLITNATGPEDYQRAFQLADVYDKLTQKQMTPQDAFNLVGPVAQNPQHFQELWNALAQETGRGTLDFNQMWEQLHPGEQNPVTPPAGGGAMEQREEMERRRQEQAELNRLGEEEQLAEMERQRQEPASGETQTFTGPPPSEAGTTGTGEPRFPVFDPGETPPWDTGATEPFDPNSGKWEWNPDTQDYDWVPNQPIDPAAIAAAQQARRQPSLSSALAGVGADQTEREFLFQPPVFGRDTRREGVPSVPSAADSYDWHQITPQEAAAGLGTAGSWVQRPRRTQVSRLSAALEQQENQQPAGPVTPLSATNTTSTFASALSQAGRRPTLPSAQGQGAAFGGTVEEGGGFFPMPTGGNLWQELYARGWNQQQQKRFQAQRPPRFSFR